MNDREYNKVQYENREQGKPLLPNGQSARPPSTESESSIPYMDRLIDSSISDICSATSSNSGNVDESRSSEGNMKRGIAARRNLNMPIVIQVDEKGNTLRAEGAGGSPEVFPNVESIGRNLRRNSISLPMGIDAIDLESMRLKYQMQEQDALSEEEKSDSVSIHLYANTYVYTDMYIQHQNFKPINYTGHTQIMLLDASYFNLITYIRHPNGKYEMYYVLLTVR